MIPVPPAAGGREGTALPSLRSELELLAGACDANGRPTWLIHDPLQNRFTQIEPAAYEALVRWRECATAEELVARVNADGRAQLDVKAVTGLVEFLYAGQLTEQPRGGWQGLATRHASQQHALHSWLMHNYLFLRLPLCRPQALLVGSLPFVRVLWSRPAQAFIMAAGLAGLYLVSRQWDLFVGTLISYFSWEGMLTGIAALAFVKVAHELGHAYAAVAFGCRVHTMGIALVLLAPMPYTDVTDAWRLSDRRKRLLIDAAGMITEAAIAAVALFLWAFLPDGPLRSTMFVLSAVSMISSLALNINPFMRFDGYYLLSEMLGVENLQSRAFALGRWRLREILFGVGAPCPEEMSSRRVAALVTYAWAVWLYRLVLFIGIALLVYHYFFKVLGIVLFVVEIVYFIARPIGGEMLVWWNMRSMILATRRTRWTFAALSFLLLASLWPWSTTIEIPAVLEFAQLQSAFSARPARVAAIHVKHGDRVQAGAPIATLASSDLEQELLRTRVSLRVAEQQYGRRVADATDRESSLVLESHIEGLRGKIAGLEREQAELRITAPFDGRIVDLNPELHPGRWISPRDQIAIVAGPRALIAKGYVAEADLYRIAPGARAHFIPEHPFRQRVELRIEQISTGGAAVVEIAELASTNDGRIAVVSDEKKRPIPATAQYQVTMSATEAVADVDLAIRGVAFAEGRAESLVARLWRRALGVLVRETGA